jgi:hypothetical protein
MSILESTDIVELRLRRALADLRPSGPAPDDLRVRVQGVPHHVGATGLRASLRRLVVAPASVAVLAAAASIVVLTFAIHPILTPPATTPGTAPAASFDPTVEGPGLVYGVVPTLLIVPGIVAVLALALLLRQLLRVRWLGGWVDMGRLVVLSAMAAGAIAFALHPGFQWLGGSLGPRIGYDVRVDPPPGSTDSDPVWYETAEPGAPLTLIISLTNPGPLPIRLEGIVEDPEAPLRLSTRWIAMTSWPDQTRILDESDLPSFAPIVVQPNEQLLVVLVARAGTCSYGPGFTYGSTDPDLSGYASRTEEIHFAYSVFGLSASAPFELPVNLVEPMRNGCPASTP